MASKSSIIVMLMVVIAVLIGFNLHNKKEPVVTSGWDDSMQTLNERLVVLDTASTNIEVDKSTLDDQQNIAIKNLQSEDKRLVQDILRVIDRKRVILDQMMTLQ